VDVIDEIWSRAIGAQPPPTQGMVLLTAAVAACLVGYRPAWSRTRHAVTIAHEGAHGFVALLSGRRLSGIRLHSDTSGLTLSRGRPSGAGMVATAFAGYVGPALIGLAAAWVLATGHAVGLLWATLVLLALLLVQIRNWFGLWSVLATATLVFVVSWWVPSDGQSAFAYLLAWFLLIAAPRPVLELQAQRRRRRAATSDADQLARLTGVPGTVWVVVFGLVNVAALALGATLLLSP
jgi:hypothetical protein